MNFRRFLHYTLHITLYTVLTGCTADYHFKKAEKLRETGKFADAADKYMSIAEKNPGHSRVPEALYKTAEIYQQNLENDSEAKKIYRRIIKNYPSTEWAGYAKEAMAELADYYPLDEKAKWVEVDSASGGSYMRAVNEVASMQNGVFLITRQLYAREKFVSSFKKYFKKTKNGIYETEMNGGIIKTLLILPPEPGRSWTGGGVRYTVVSDKENVTVIAGKFSNCIKIKKQLIGTASWSYEYYAPEVGEILLTQSSGADEKRISELKEFSIPTE